METKLETPNLSEILDDLKLTEIEFKPINLNDIELTDFGDLELKDFGDLELQSFDWEDLELKGFEDIKLNGFDDLGGLD